MRRNRRNLTIDTAAIPAGVDFGALPRTRTEFGDGTFPCYSDRFQLIPEKLWQPISLSRFVRHIFGQIDGHCTSNAFCQAAMINRVMCGRRHRILAPEYLYRLHSRDGTGSSLIENTEYMLSHGVPFRSTIPQSMNKRQYNSAHAKEALQNRFIEVADLDGLFEAVATALQRYLVPIIGVEWPGRRGGGHSVAVTELIKERDGWHLGGPNSWGKKWKGTNPDLPLGFYDLSRRQCRTMPNFGAFTPLVVTEAA